ncbi:MAG TPA: nuclear transport factor 2 family protein [Longimicrobiales bacterium]
MTHRILLALVLAPLIASQAAAQAPSLTSAQAQVWSVVEQVWRLTGEDRFEDALSHYHANWHRWGYSVPDLWDRDHLRAFLRASNEGIETRTEIRPELVQLHGDAALVHYLAAVKAVEPESGKMMERAIRFSDFLIREGGRWRIIGGYRDDQCALSPSPWAPDWVCSPPVLDVSDGSWEERPMNPSEMEKYVGTYMADEERVEVWIEEGRLRITPGESSGVERIELVPMGGHTFAQGHYEDGTLRKIHSPGVRVVFVEENGAIQRYELRIGEVVIEVGRRVP